MIRSITTRYYEPGNHLRSYKAVWRRWVNPVYPMTYDTYLRLLQIDDPGGDGSPNTGQQLSGEPGQTNQLTIFDVL